MAARRASATAVRCPTKLPPKCASTGSWSASVLSGNRNFEGRIQQDVRANYLASPPLVVAYALAGTMNLDLTTEPLGTGSDGKPSVPQGHLAERAGNAAGDAARRHRRKRSERSTRTSSRATERWRALPVPTGDRFQWDESSTYIRRPPFLENLTREPPTRDDIRGARVLALLGDSITTDHISPAGSIKADSPAGRYLIEHGVQPRDFNSYGARRGNHEVMMRGTFANVRLRNQLAPGTEGGVTTYFLGSPRASSSVPATVMSIYDAAMLYQKRRYSADRHCRQGIRFRIVARLGGQGDDAAWCQGGDRRELRAHSSQQPGEHGRAAAGIQAGESADELGPDRSRSVRARRLGDRAPPRGEVRVRAHSRERHRSSRSPPPCASTRRRS